MQQGIIQFLNPNCCLKHERFKRQLKTINMSQKWGQFLEKKYGSKDRLSIKSFLDKNQILPTRIRQVSHVIQNQATF